MAESGIAPEEMAKLEIWWPSGLLGSNTFLIKPLSKALKVPVPANSSLPHAKLILAFGLFARGARRECIIEFRIINGRKHGPVF